MATIIEALENAEYNLKNPLMKAQALIGFNQLHNATMLLVKGYSPHTEIDPLLEKHGSVEAVPELDD